MISPQELDEAQHLAEREVLRWLLANRGLPETMPLLNADAFHVETHQQLFERLNELAMHQADPREWAALKADIEALSVNPDAAAADPDLSDGLRRMSLAMSVRTMEEGLKSWRKIQSLDDVEEQIFTLDASIMRVAYRERWPTVRTGSHALADAIQELNRTADAEEEANALTTGFPALDGYLPPFQQPSMLVLAGSTGTELWKLASCLLHQWAVDQRRKVYCRLMGETDEADIMLSLLLKNESLVSWRRRERPKAQWEADLTPWATRLNESPIVFNAHSSRDLDTHRKELYPMRKHASCDIAILDGVRHGDADTVDVAAFTKSLRVACKDLNILHVVLIEGVGVSSASDPLSALGAWRPLGEAARTVLLLDTDYTQPPVEDLSQQSVIIARNARGPVGRVVLGAAKARE